MVLLDFGPYYTQTGEIIQLDYAKKCVATGSTIIGIKYKTGVLIAVESPIESHLIYESPRIKKINPNIYMAYTGLLTDGKFVEEILKYSMTQYSDWYDRNIYPGMYKEKLSMQINLYTRYGSTRPFGCNFISSIVHQNKAYLIGTECDGKSNYYKAITYGKGSQRARTELEKLDIDDLCFDIAVENAVRIMYKSYDPLRDKEFTIMMTYVDQSTNFEFKNVDIDLIETYVDRYQHLSVEE